jgi:hypothetical protein
MIYISRPGDSLTNIILSHYGPTQYAQNYDRVIRANYRYLDYYFPNITALQILDNFQAVELPENSFYGSEADMVRFLNGESVSTRAALRSVAEAGISPSNLIAATRAATPNHASASTDKHISPDDLADYANSFIGSTADTVKDSADKFDKAFNELRILMKEYSLIPAAYQKALVPQLKTAYNKTMQAYHKRFFALKRVHATMARLSTMRNAANTPGFEGLTLGDAGEEIIRIGRKAARISRGCVVVDLALDTVDVAEAYHHHQDWMKEAFVDYGTSILAGGAGFLAGLVLSPLLGGLCLMIAGFGVGILAGWAIKSGLEELWKLFHAKQNNNLIIGSAHE